VLFERATVSCIWHPGRSMDVFQDKTRIGTLGEIHPVSAARFKIDRRVAVADLDFNVITAVANQRKSYVPIPEFPPAKRDVAFVVGQRIEHAAIQGRLEETGKLLTKIELFDVFEDKGKMMDKKSMAYHLEFSAPDRTLTAEEVEAMMEKLRAMLKEEF